MGYVAMDPDVEYTTLGWNMTDLSTTVGPNDTEDALGPMGNSTLSSVVASYQCSEAVDSFGKRYKEVHGYISLLVCIFGSVANGLNVAVLTRKEMSSPTNTILTGLAVADMIVMAEYIPFACHIYIAKYQHASVKYSYSWALFVLFHAHFTQVFHTISIYLTLTLAVWRYIAVCFPLKNRNWCSTQRAAWVVASAYIVSPLICIPFYLSFAIMGQVHLQENTNTNVTLYLTGISDMAKANNNLFYNINFWIYSVVIKILPCIALTVLSICLINALMETKRRKQKLTQRSQSLINADGAGNSRGATISSNAVSDSERQTDRTTRMLLAVLLLFLITEFPQGILGLCSGILGDKFFNSCYTLLGEIMDVLALINCAINFILYCTMSRQFRSTFGQLFKPKIFNKWISVPQNEPHTCTTHVSHV